MTTTPTKRAPPSTYLRKVGHFLWHYVQMCLVMCAGGAILTFAFFGGAALLGYPDLFAQAPVFSTLVLAINLSVAMVAWMSFRQHAWRPTLEMAGASVGLGISLIALGLLGLIPMSDIFEWEASLCCPAMLVPMLFRYKLYIGGMDHQVHGTASNIQTSVRNVLEDRRYLENARRLQQSIRRANGKQSSAEAIWQFLTKTGA